MIFAVLVIKLMMEMVPSLVFVTQILLSSFEMPTLFVQM